MDLQYIFDMYSKFQMEYDDEFIYPNIYPMFKKLDNQINAQIEKVTNRSVHLTINQKFLLTKYNKIYFDSVLYHEFTHIVDALTYLINERDENGYTFLAFPFNEYHASQIQFLKMVNIFNSGSGISISSKVNIVDEILTINQFIYQSRYEIQRGYLSLNSKSKLEDVLFFIYNIIYNIGYYSILKLHDVCDSFWFDFSILNYVEGELHILMDMLLNTLPTDQLCLDTNKVTTKIIAKMLNYYEIEMD